MDEIVTGIVAKQLAEAISTLEESGLAPHLILRGLEIGVARYRDRLGDQGGAGDDDSPGAA